MFGLCLKEMKLLGVDGIKMQPAAFPGFLEVKGVTLKKYPKDPVKLCIKLDGEEIVELLLLRRKRPKKMTPEEFFQEIRSSAYDGDGARVE